MGFDPALNLFDEGYSDGPGVPGDDGERSSNPHRDEDQAQVAPDGHAPCITQTYHPSINGKSVVRSSQTVIFIDSFLVSGTICDKHGNDIPRDTPSPPCPSDRGPDDWTPYNNRIEFEVADFLYRRNQMSGGDADFIFNLWAASLAAYNDAPPFANHNEMYETIDSTPVGDVPWESVTMEYDGVRPDNNVPSWMMMKYDAWFRNPRDLVHNIISNPDFDGKFDYGPLQEYTTDGVHRFQNVMSGDWCWKQAVSWLRNLCSCLTFFAGLDC